jgi:hypothetical protein
MEGMHPGHKTKIGSPHRGYPKQVRAEGAIACTPQCQSQVYLARSLRIRVKVLSSSRGKATVDLRLQQVLRHLLGTIVKVLCVSHSASDACLLHTHYTSSAMQRDSLRQIAAQTSKKRARITRAEPCDAAHL